MKIRKLLLVALGMMFLTSCSNAAESGYIYIEVAPIRHDANAVVTIISDDGDLDSGRILNSLAKEYNLKVTVAGIAAWMEKNLPEWKNIEDEGYIELISHSYNHHKMNDETDPDEETLQHQLTDSINFYKAHFKTDQICFVPPNNCMTSRGYEILAYNGILAIRQGERGENYLNPFDGKLPGQWYNLLTRGIGDVETTNERNQWVDSSVENTSWLIEMWHNISPNGDSGYQPISTDMAREHLEYLVNKRKTNEIWIASFVDATKYIKEQQNANVTAYLEDDLICVDLNVDYNTLDKAVFSYPLTVKMEIPINWRDDDIQIEGENIDYIRKVVDQVEYLIFDMLPGSTVSISRG